MNKNIEVASKKIKETIEKFCNQNDNEKRNLLDFLHLKLGINVDKYYQKIDSKSLCNQENKDWINKICDMLCQDGDILFKLS